MASDNRTEAVDFSFAVGGMTCASCVRFVEKELRGVPGVSFVSVNLADGRTYAVTDGRPTWEDLSSAVLRAGYEPRTGVPDDDAAGRDFRAAGRRVLVSWAVAVPAMILMVLHMTGVHIPSMVWWEAAAGIGVILGPGRSILKGARIALMHRHANMDVLVSLGALAAWASAVLALGGLPVRSFGSLAPMLPAFHLTGRYIEARLRRRAGADLRALMSMDGGSVTVLEDGREPLEVPVEAVRTGMRIRVRTGERIPLDGEVVSGDGAVSEAMITGEPLPVVRGAGDEVIGGTVLESGLLEIRVTRTGPDAFLARMLELMQQAQGVKVPLQALADRVAGVFVPVVAGLSAAAFAAWVVFHPVLDPLLERAARVLPWVPAGQGAWTTALFAAISLLVVACPCALGLATPMALSVGGGLAARRGLLIKSGEALQSAGELDVLLFDKTGTLTEGRPRVVLSTLESEAAAAAVLLEASSVHPLARAVVEWGGAADRLDPYPAAGGAGGGMQMYPGSRPDTAAAASTDTAAGRTMTPAAVQMPATPVLSPAPVLTDVRETAGEGISGRIGGVLWEVGRPRTAGTEPDTPAAGSSDAAVPARTSQAETSDRTVIEVRRDGVSAGVLELTDPVREGAAAAVAALKRRGVRPLMLTGDGRGAALAAAAAVGIDAADVRWSLRPEEKLRAVQEFQGRGLRVGMVGDGINDAAALKAADVGFALAGGTDLSLEAGDIVIMHGGLGRIEEALRLSLLMVRTIRGNLFWAFVYNLVALPAAAAALIHPLAAEAAMSFSSIGVILNSLAIRSRHERAGRARNAEDREAIR